MFFKISFLSLLSGLIFSVPALSACPKDKPIPSLTGCMPCDTPEIIYAFQCLNCNEPNVDVLTVCPNRKKVSFGSGWGTVLKKCPSEKPIRNHEDTCYHCDDEKNIFVSKDYINPCPNRTIYQHYEMFYSALKCPSEKPLRDLHFGKCYSCNTTAEITLAPDISPDVCPYRKNTVNQYGNTISQFICPPEKPIFGQLAENKKFDCFACDSNKTIYVENKENPCPSRTLFRNYSSLNYISLRCPDDKPLMDNTKKCHSADTENFVQVQDHTQNRFPNREIIFLYGRNYYSVLKCPPELPIRDEWGKCHSADEKKIWLHPTAVNTLNDREIVKDDDYIYSYLKCPPDKPLRSVDGDCYPADTPQQIEVNKNTKNIFPNRQIIKNGYRYESVLNCTDDKPLMSISGFCLPATYIHPIEVLPNTPNLYENRQIVSMDGKTYSVLKECPAERPLQSTDYTCYSVTTDKAVPVDKETQDKFENRQIVRMIATDYSIPKCTPSKPIVEKWYKKPVCTSCGFYQHQDVYFHKNKNDMGYFYPLNPADCETLCPDMHLIDDVCSACPKGQFPFKGTCRPCDDPTIIPIDDRYALSTLCPNRTVIDATYTKFSGVETSKIGKRNIEREILKQKRKKWWSEFSYSASMLFGFFILPALIILIPLIILIVIIVCIVKKVRK